MTTRHNFTHARRTVLAAAVVIGMSTPLSVSAAMAAPEDPTNQSTLEVQADQKQARQTSTVGSAALTPERPNEEPATSHSPEVSKEALEDQKQNNSDAVDAATENEDSRSVPVAASGESTATSIEPSVAASQIQTQAHGNAQAKSPSHQQVGVESSEPEISTASETTSQPIQQVSDEEDHSEQAEVSETPQNASGEKEAVDEVSAVDHQDMGSVAGQGSAGDSATNLLENEEPVNEESEHDSSKESEVGDEEKGDNIDDGVEDDEEDRADEEKLTVTPKGPELSLDLAAPETEYQVRVGDHEIAYSTNKKGSVAINLIEDFELPPGAHQVIAIGPGGQEQEITFYATHMQAERSHVNIQGLDPDLNYRLELNGQVVPVGTLDFTSLPEGTFSLDIHEEFPHAWPGKHAVTLTGGGYNQTVYVNIPTRPPNPDPEPEPWPNPSPDPEPEPWPNPKPDPEPNPSPDPEPNPSPDPEPEPWPNPKPDPDRESSSSEPSSQQQDDTVSPASAEEEDSSTAPSDIETLDTLQTAEAIQNNERLTIDAGELPLASTGRGRHAAPQPINNVGPYEQSIESAPMPHRPIPMDQNSSGPTDTQRNAPIETNNSSVKPEVDETTTLESSNLNSGKTSISGWGVTALLAAALVLIGVLSMVFLVRKKTD